MGDTLKPTHGLHSWFFIRALPVLIKCRSHGSGIPLMQMTNQQLRKPNLSDTWLKAPQTNRLAHERFTDKPSAASPSDLPIAAHPANLTALVIRQLGQLLRQLPLAPTVPPGGRCLLHRLVRPLLVVSPKPAGASMLLSPARPRHWPGGFALHHPMELFVRAIVLRTRWARKFHPDSQPRPPRTQLRKTRRAARGEGTAVIHTNHFRQTPLSKKPCKDCLDRGHVLAGQQPHQQAIPTEQITHRQWFTALAVTRSEPALEIHRPYVVGTACDRQPRVVTHARFPRPAAPRVAQLQTLEPAPQRPATGWFGPLPLKPRTNFLGPPERMLPAHLPQPLNPMPFQPPRHPVRTSTAIRQPSTPFSDKTRLPFIGSLTADAKNCTPTFDRLFVPEQQLDQTPPLPNCRLNPRHDRGKTGPFYQKVLPMSCLQSVTHVLSSCREVRVLTAGNSLSRLAARLKSTSHQNRHPRRFRRR